jgi:FkbM family methyltransferase
VLQPGDLVIDAGAYKGGYTYWMRDAVGATGRVIAFEPQPELAAFLERMVEAFRWDNVLVEPMGLSSGRAARTLFVPGQALPSGRRSNGSAKVPAPTTWP